ncbi:MAG: DNA polymerase I [Paracoccaceae bacterium]
MGLSKGDHLYLVDGSGYIFRAYHTMPPLTRRSDGKPVGAVAGFCNMIHRMVQGFGIEPPTHLAVIFDHSSQTFRNEIYPDYKAHRPAPPEDLVEQFPLIREATRAFGLPAIEMEGFEADDLIATYARAAREAGAHCTIVSSDKDLAQLVGSGVVMLDPIKEKTYDREGVEAHWGVGPERMVDFQALVGDASDNVPGAPGIGPKTAVQLLRDYGGLDDLLARAEEIKQPKRRQTLVDFADQIRLSRRLVTLKDDVPVEDRAEDFALERPDPERLLGWLASMEFRTLTARIAEAYGTDAPAVGERPAPSAGNAAPTGGKEARVDDSVTDFLAAVEQPQDETPKAADAPGARRTLAPLDATAYAVVRDRAGLDAVIAAAYETGLLSVDLETTALDEMVAEIVGIALCAGDGRAVYVPVNHVEGEADLFSGGKRVEGQMERDEALDALKTVLTDRAVMKIGQNTKYDANVFARYDMRVEPFDDTMLMSYALDSGSNGHGMDELSQLHLGHRCIPIAELIGTGKGKVTFDKVAIEKAAPYAAEDADVTLRLWHVLRPRLAAEKVSTVYHTLERPLVPVLTAMERAGIKVDRDVLSRMSSGFAQKMLGLEAEIHELAGRQFNVGSPKQLGEILFDEQKLPGGKRGKGGAWGTGADVLEWLAAQGHELPARVLDWRGISKLKSTYTDALVDHVNAETGRVHTSFSMAATSTGRLASSDPNLQNIPVRTEEGRAIRRAFVPEAGNLLLSLDYSQIELRILAHVADIAALKSAFRDGQDIHAITASEVFGVPLDQMTPDIRRQAKAVNFGVIYGISSYGLSNNLRISREEAQKFIDAYFERFPGIRDYIDDTLKGARERGYVETLFGRRIHTPGITTKGPGRGFAERQAINAPIQGTAADVIRRAMIRVPDAMAEAKLSGRMLLQVHDELLFEVPEGEAEKTVEVVKEVMEGAERPAVGLTVPLLVEAGSGMSWAEAH